MINVDECSFHVGKDLNSVLKLLADIVRFPQWRACVHGNIYLYEVVWAALENKRLLENRPPDSEIDRKSVV